MFYMWHTILSMLSKTYNTEINAGNLIKHKEHLITGKKPPRLCKDKYGTMGGGGEKRFKSEMKPQLFLRVITSEKLNKKYTVIII